MLEHLDAENAIEADVLGEIILLNIPRKNLQIPQPPLLCRLININLLRLAIRKCLDPAIRILLCQIKAKASPPTPEIKHVLPIDELRLLAVGGKHGLLCFVEGLFACFVEAARVFGAGAEAGEHEVGVHFVVLLVSRFRLDCDFVGLEALDVCVLEEERARSERSGGGCSVVDDSAAPHLLLYIAAEGTG